MAAASAAAAIGGLGNLYDPVRFRSVSSSSLGEAGREVRLDLSRRQGGRVDGHVSDRPVEVIASRLGRALAVAAPRVEVPAVEVVAADPPVAGVDLRRAAGGGAGQLS